MAYRFKSGHLSLKSHSLVTGWRRALTRRRGHSFGGPRGTSRNDGSPASGRRCGCKEPALLGLPWAPHLELGLLRGWAGRCVRGEERARGLWREDMSLGQEAGDRDWPSAPRGDAAAAQLPPRREGAVLRPGGTSTPALTLHAMALPTGPASSGGRWGRNPRHAPPTRLGDPPRRARGQGPRPAGSPRCPGG